MSSEIWDSNRDNRLENPGDLKPTRMRIFCYIFTAVKVNNYPIKKSHVFYGKPDKPYKFFSCFFVFCMPPSLVSHRVNPGGALRNFGLATLLGPITGRASVSFNSKLLLGHTLRKVNIDLGLFKNGISLKIAWRK